jgi:hypothetical protein
MAKKASKPKPKAQYAWVYSPTATAADKIRIEKDFQELIAELKSQLPPLEKPQVVNQVVDITTKWRGNQFYIIQKYKCPDNGNYIAEGFDAPLVRLEFYGVDRFNVSVQRHNGQWMELPMYANSTTAQVIEGIKTDPWMGI